jgi:hypothetical protein
MGAWDDARHHAAARDHHLARRRFVTTEIASPQIAGIVNDIVVGTVNVEQATVTVNGGSAQVANRRSSPRDPARTRAERRRRSARIASAPGDDDHDRAAGGRGTKRIQAVSGNNQTAPIGLR